MMWCCPVETDIHQCASYAAGSVRYWLGAGQGGFGISPLECIEPSFYCMVYHNKDVPDYTKVTAGVGFIALCPQHYTALPCAIRER